MIRKNVITQRKELAQQWKFSEIVLGTFKSIEIIRFAFYWILFEIKSNQRQVQKGRFWPCFCQSFKLKIDLKIQIFCRLRFVKGSVVMIMDFDLFWGFKVYEVHIWYEDSTVNSGFYILAYLIAFVILSRCISVVSVVRNKTGHQCSFWLGAVLHIVITNLNIP